MATSKRATNGADTSTHPMTDKLQSTLHESVDTSMRETSSATADNLAARKRLAKQKWQQSKVRNYAVENPLAAAGIAFAAGMLVTTLLKKSK